MQIDIEEVEQEEKQNPLLVKKFEAFFKAKLKKDIEKLAQGYPEKRSLLVDFNELSSFDYKLADDLLSNPDLVLEAAELAVSGIDVPNLAVDEFKPYIRFINLPKEKESSPLVRDISAKHLNKLLVVDGVVRQITDVLPRLMLAAWQCRRCGKIEKIIQEKRQQQMPMLCECKHRDFQLLEEQCQFIDSQKIQIQEPLELLKGGEQATFLDIYLTDDLVNKVGAGDRVEVTGILRLLPPKDAKDTVYRRYLDANFVSETEKEFEELEINEEEEKEIRDLAKDPLIYEKLVQSLAPNIYGHELVKEAIILQLFGGAKKVLPDGTKIRGNMHVLLIGDPGTAKSSLLQAADRIAPKSIYVAGKTSSGVGLTASAVKDEFGEGGWVLKAGALVLASGGATMVDEFDKMDPEDRGAMHEALEQQCISVAKAGIVTRFKTETSVLAAANPKFGRFDEYENPLKQINLPPTLFSRFDLYFMIRDVLDKTKDRQIAEHILKSHKAGEILHSHKVGMGAKISKKQLKEIEESIAPAIDSELLKKYLSFARQSCYPVMTKESMEKIVDFYIALRDEGRQQGGVFAATHRQLEGLIRLSEASARVRLKDKVEIEDVDRAIKLFKRSLSEVGVDPDTKQYDIDIITTGRSHSQLTNMKKVLSIVKAKAREFDTVPIEQIIEEAAKEGIDAEKTRDFVAELHKKGELYEVRHGLYKPTQKESF